MRKLYLLFAISTLAFAVSCEKDYSDSYEEYPSDLVIWGLNGPVSKVKVRYYDYSDDPDEERDPDDYSYIEYLEFDEAGMLLTNRVGIYCGDELTREYSYGYTERDKLGRVVAVKTPADASNYNPLTFKFSYNDKTRKCKITNVEFLMMYHEDRSLDKYGHYRYLFGLFSGVFQRMTTVVKELPPNDSDVSYNEQGNPSRILYYTYYAKEFNTCYEFEYEYYE